MKVKLINYTQNALELLLLTKNTRLQEQGVTIQEIKDWPEDKKMKELDYMLKTIQSSWEFVDYTFEIRDVSRAFTHQFVRTRKGSYAQQSQRSIDMSYCFDFVMPEDVEKYPDQKGAVKDIVEELKEGYFHLTNDLDISPQDARGILPINICTNIIAKFDLRTLSEMAKLRLCTRTQGEYQKVFKAMKEEVIKVHPWAEPFIRVYCSAVGVCQFPNYQECPIKPDIFNPESGVSWGETEGYDFPDNYIELSDFRYPANKEEIEAGFRKMNYEADPHVKYGGRKA